MEKEHYRWNIADTLDRNHVTSLYWSLALMATIGGFLFGYDTSNIGSALTFIPYKLSGLALGYLVAGASLGAALGALLAGPITDRFGRKALLLVDAAIYAVGALLSALTVDAGMLLVARTLVGLAVGADSAVATAYIAEYAPKDRRGKLAIIQQWMVTIGILAAYVVAIIVFRALPGHAASLDWRLILGLGAVPALVGLGLRVKMPESPRWLFEKGLDERLIETLALLGIHVDRQTIREARQKESQDEEKTPRPVISGGVRRAFVVVAVFMIFQQITGINVPFYYGPKILEPYFARPHMSLVGIAVSGIEATLVLAVVNVLATYIGFRNIDSFGRKSLARLGYGGMALFMILSAGAFAFLSGPARAWTVLVTLAGFIVFFAFGVGGTGWIIQGEYFPTAVRGRMAALAAVVDWIANFAITELFPVMHSHWGLPADMLVFAGLAVLAVIFVSVWMPETKGLSVEAIATLFEQQSHSSRTE
ncbi:sugar porter family MFS transporter [Sulfobacillus harzensis]|uniref:Sugar porter family MFS transporter n=1 Tax=Sulfobacillus harzensis TaxID=2729629 RepID=A0A7Y0L6Z3_9FIRM|nr:sugar porter family MFS transporter [Sulfobacillus harzensis]NMP24082.1 sugar porter family MFS transporter [Sulfobacillus harzensis]